MKGFILDSDCQNNDEKAEVILFGKLENGESFAAKFDFNPYFYIREKDYKKIKKYFEKYKVEETKKTNFQEEKVVKVIGKNTTENNKLIEYIHKSKIDTYEADVKPVMRFIMDNNLLSSVEIEGDHEKADYIDRVYTNPIVRPSDYTPTNLKVVSIDLESSKTGGELFCIGLYGENYEKNFIVSKEKIKNAVNCLDERECLTRFKEEIQKIDPDIITGWNMIDFDLVYLKELFAKHKIPYVLGRTNATTKIRIEENFFRSSKAEVEGRQVLDAMNLIKDPFIQEAPSIKNSKFESYSLEDVSQKILKEGKILKGKKRHDEIEELFKKDKNKLVEYNIQDCKLAYLIVETTKIIPLLIERSKLTGIEFDKITASIQAFDSLYIRLANTKGLVNPSTRYSAKEEKIKGAYVKSPEAGLYENVLVLDFKSLYPSVLTTFNIDPASHLLEKEKGAVESPNKEYYRNTDGILPEIIKKLHVARELAKKEKRELSNYAIKIIMNSFWGVLASPNCRYFNFNMASSITAFARFIIQNTEKEIQEKFKKKVLYIDTDSVFVMAAKKEKEADKLGKEIEEHINNYYKKYVKDNYNRESSLEIQYQKQYLNLMFPNTRNKTDEEGQAQAAKKRYAGLIKKDGEEELEITGLEAIRGDWTEAAQEFQKELLIKVFKHEEYEKFIRDYIKKIKEGKMNAKLIYRKSIRKDLSEYTKTTPPHVKAARKLPELTSSVIEYYITEDGPEPIQKLTHKLNYEHYIEKQIMPIANQILSLLNTNFEDVSKGSKQKKLF